MANSRSFRISGQIVAGIAAILFGVLFLLDNMDILDARMYVRYWPVFLIVFGLIRFLQPHTGGGGRVFGGVLLVIGSVLLLRAIGLIDFGFYELWPLILVLIGGSLLWGGSSRTRVIAGDGTPADLNSYINGFAMMGGFQRSNNSQNFRGGELTAIMGGCEIDLRHAAIEGDEAVINTFAFWGGIKLKVPQTWNVIVQGFPFMGGYDDKTLHSGDPAAKRLVIKGTAIMGGFEITN